MLLFFHFIYKNRSFLCTEKSVITKHSTIDDEREAQFRPGIPGSGPAGSASPPASRSASRHALEGEAAPDLIITGSQVAGYGQPAMDAKRNLIAQSLIARLRPGEFTRITSHRQPTMSSVGSSWLFNSIDHHPSGSTQAKKTNRSRAIKIALRVHSRLPSRAEREQDSALLLAGSASRSSDKKSLDFISSKDLSIAYKNRNLLRFFFIVMDKIFLRNANKIALRVSGAPSRLNQSLFGSIGLSASSSALSRPRSALNPWSAGIGLTMRKGFLPPILRFEYFFNIKKYSARLSREIEQSLCRLVAPLSQSAIAGDGTKPLGGIQILLLPYILCFGCFFTFFIFSTGNESFFGTFLSQERLSMGSIGLSTRSAIRIIKSNIFYVIHSSLTVVSTILSKMVSLLTQRIAILDCAGLCPCPSPAKTLCDSLLVIVTNFSSCIAASPTSSSTWLPAMPDLLALEGAAQPATDASRYLAAARDQSVEFLTSKIEAAPFDSFSRVSVFFYTIKKYLSPVLDSAWPASPLVSHGQPVSSSTLCRALECEAARNLIAQSAIGRLTHSTFDRSIALCVVLGKSFSKNFFWSSTTDSTDWPIVFSTGFEESIAGSASRSSYEKIILNLAYFGIEFLRFANYSSKLFVIWGILNIWKGVRPGQSTKNEYSISLRIFYKNRKKFADLEGIDKFLPILNTCLETFQIAKKKNLLNRCSEWLARARREALLLSRARREALPRATRSKPSISDYGGQDAKRALDAKCCQVRSILPKGYLFVGPPGTGKTLLGRALAGEAKVPFLGLSASEIQKQIDIGTKIGAIRLRNLFFTAKQHSPCILFFDEIDSIGRMRERSYSQSFDGYGRGVASPYAAGYGRFALSRCGARSKNEKLGSYPALHGSGDGREALLLAGKSSSQGYDGMDEGTTQPASSSALEGTTRSAAPRYLAVTRDSEGRAFSKELEPYNEVPRESEDPASPANDLSLFTEFLIQMDSVQAEKGLIIIGTTNFFSNLDSAFIRSGRFDRIIGLEYPGKETRINLLKLYTKQHGYTFADDLASRPISRAARAGHEVLLPASRSASRPLEGEAARDLLAGNLTTERQLWVELAEKTKGFSAADLSKVVNESLLYKIRECARLRPRPEPATKCSPASRSASRHALKGPTRSAAARDLSFEDFKKNSSSESFTKVFHTYESLNKGIEKISLREQFINQ
jgi:SpoVK/Ycf46/Vps4 family AAA+-type ATPase